MVHSVVIPAYNAESTVAAAVASALRQSVDDVEVIVIDDGSTDGTADAVAAIGDPRVRLLGDGRNRGLAATRNLGLEAASGELVSFLDADDLWLPTYLETMRAALDANPRAGLAACDAWRFETGTGRIFAQTYFDLLRPSHVRDGPRGMLLAHLAENWFYVGTTIRRSAYEQVGGFAEELTALEDWEYWLRIQLAGYELVEVQQPLALYRVSGSQMSADALRMATSYVALFDLLERRGLPDAETAAVVARRKRGARRFVRAVRRPLSLAGLRRSARTARARIARRVRPARQWMREPPAAIARHFPDLA